MNNDQKFCNKCGEPLLPKSNFCSSCGAKVLNVPTQKNASSAISAPATFTQNAEKKGNKVSKLFTGIFVALALMACGYFFVNPCMLGHNWKDASCVDAKTCSTCGMIEGKPLGHHWLAATCEEPKRCKTCGETIGENKAHEWTEATDTNPAKCISCGLMEKMPLPESGQVFIGKDLSRGSHLTIKSDSTESTYVKLKDRAGNDVFSFFVQAGTNVDVPVPRGEYYVYFAHGKDWYGPNELFGDTSYGKDDEILDFTSYSWEYTLTPVLDGNFSETSISEDEF